MPDPSVLLREELKLLESALARSGAATGLPLRLLALARSLDDASWACLHAELCPTGESLSYEIAAHHMRHRLQVEIDRAKLCSVPLTVAVLQQDATEGDNASAAKLCSIACENLRSFDRLCIQDGGRVLVALAGTGLGTAERLIGGVLRHIRQVLSTDDGESLCLCSAGLVGYGGCVEISPEELITRAETALDQARQRGGNRLEVGPPVDVLAAPRSTLVHANEKHFLFTGKRMPE